MDAMERVLHRIVQSCAVALLAKCKKPLERSKICVKVPDRQVDVFSVSWTAMRALQSFNWVISSFNTVEKGSI